MSAAIAVVGGKGSPGATTFGLALAAAMVDAGRSPVLVEADTAGGDLAARLGLASNPGLESLAAAGRHRFDGSDVDRHLQSLANGVRLLAAPSSGRATRSSLKGAAAGLADWIDGLDAVVDLGRWPHEATAQPLLDACATAVLVIHPTVAGVAHAREELDALRTRIDHVEVFTLGERPYAREDVAEVLDLDRVAPLPLDGGAVTALLRDAPLDRWARRTALLRVAADWVAGHQMEGAAQ